MKAESFVYTGAQKPMTMFGLPPIVLGLVLVLAVATFGGFIATRLLALSLPAAVIALAVGWITMFRKQRADHHFAHVLLALPSFWRKPQTRTLIAGQPLKRAKGGKA